MARTTEHGRLIAEAAKAALGPLGCVRKGRSRVWYSDQRYLLIAVEFQPSGWSKGSYLNIFLAWLWRRSKGYDHSYRPVDFLPFVKAEQFAPRIIEMAAVAAREVVSTKERLRSLGDICAFIQDTKRGTPSREYNAAVAFGLAGDIQTAREHFEKLAGWPEHGYAWERQLKTEGAALTALLGQPRRFREAVLSIVEDRRELMRLSPDAHCLDELDTIRGL